MSQDHDLVSFSVGHAEERYVCVCSRQPNNQEMRDIKGIEKKNEKETNEETPPPTTTPTKPAIKSEFSVFY